MTDNHDELYAKASKAVFPGDGTTNRFVSIDHNDEHFTCLLELVPILRIYSATGKCVLSHEIEQVSKPC